MLAIISDLHFCDGTASERNVEPKAFAIVLREIYDSAIHYGIKKLDLTLLGDVFDLLRTEAWFDAPEAERPWGDPKSLDGAPPDARVIGRVDGVLGRILDVNAEALATLRGEVCPPPAGLQVRRIFLPGNHDRLYSHDKGLRDRMRSALGVLDETHVGGGIHAHRLELPSYGLLARHGHEWDDWNFERYRPGAVPSDYSDADYLPTPIGDAITTELAARLPWEMKRRLAPSNLLDDQEKVAVYRRLQRIEDVRPTLAAFQWAYYETERIKGDLDDSRKKTLLRDALGDTVHALAANFLGLRYFEAWYERHHRCLHIFDSAAMFKDIVKGLLRIDLGIVEEVMRVLDRVRRSPEPRDTCRNGALQEDLRTVGTKGLRFVVYGHTHDSLETALHADASREDVYLNSGTFRQGIFSTDDKLGFIGWERLTYLVFFSEDEANVPPGPEHRVGPGFLAWTGERNK